MFSSNFFALSAHAIEKAERKPFQAREYDLGIAVGESLSSSNYAMLQLFGGFQVDEPDDHHVTYLDGTFASSSQSGETHYSIHAGPRFQWFNESSMWGPFVRGFVGNNHRIFQGEVKDTAFGGVGVGTYYYLHRVADLRIDLSQSFGPVSLTFISVGMALKWGEFISEVPTDIVQPPK